MSFEVVSGYTGNVDGKEKYQSFVLTIQKKEAFDQEVEDFIDEIGSEDAKGFKFVKSKNTNLKDSRMLLNEISFNDRKIPINLNEKDIEIFTEEQYILKQAKILTGDKKIEDIEPQEIIDKEFVRIYNGKRYILFKKLKSGNGAVVVRK